MRRAGIDAKLTISYDGARVARSILDSLDPDNKFRLRGLKVRGWVRGRKVIVDIHCERGMNSLINTLEDIFSCMGVAEEGLSSLKGLRGEVRGRERGRQGQGRRA